MRKIILLIMISSLMVGCGKEEKVVNTQISPEGIETIEVETIDVETIEIR